MRVSGGLVEVMFHNELHGLHVQGRVDRRGRREREMVGRVSWFQTVPESRSDLI